MLQELIRLHIAGREIPIFGYGLMLVIGFLAGSQLAAYLARRFGLDGQAFANGAMLALLSGLVGARLSHILENISQFTNAPDPIIAMFNLQSGGLTYYGGVLAALPVVLLYARFKRLPPRLSMDILAPCLMIGLGFGRIGCYLNGCCYGSRCDTAWAVRFPYQSAAYADQFSKGQLIPPPELVHWQDGRAMLVDVSADRGRKELAAIASRARSLPVHPVQLYSSFTAFLLAAILLAYLALPHAPGRVLAVCLVLEGLTRYILELVRTEPTVLGRLSLSMIIGLGLMLAGVAWWRICGKLAKPPGVGRPMERNLRGGVYAGDL